MKQRLEHDRLALASCRVLALLNGTQLFGQEKGNIQVLRTLRELGAKILVGVSPLGDGEDVKDYIEQSGFETISFPFGGQWSKRLFRENPTLIATNLASVWNCSELVRAQVRKLGATHLHIGSQSAYSFIAPYLAIDKRIQLVYRMGDEPPHESRPNLLIWKSCYKRANVVVANSNFVRQSILRARPQGQEKLRLIYNRASLGSDSTSSDSGPRIKRGMKSSTGTHLLYVGQLSQHKGIEDILSASFDLMKIHSDLQLDILGKSPYNSDYQSSLEERVRKSPFAERILFHGYQKDPTPFYEDADLLVVPSRFEEPAANVVLEAKRSGVPSIVYPSGGLPELITHGENGIVCRDKSVAALAEAIQWYLRAPSLLVQHQLAALADNEARFGHDRFCRQWRDVYLGTTSVEKSLVSQ